MYSLYDYFQSFAQNMITVGMDFSLKFDWLGNNDHFEVENATDIISNL